MSGYRPRFFIAPLSPSGRAPGAFVEKGGMGSDEGQAEGGLEGVEFALSPEDSHHALRVLRLGEGDACEVVIGAAVYAASVVAATDPVKVLLAARLRGPEAGAAYRVSVGLVQALVRSNAMDYVVEKGTEVGAGFFLLVHTAGSPKTSLRLGGERVARWRRIAQEAAKQSKQTAVPPLAIAESVTEALDVVARSAALSLVLEPGAVEGLHQVLSSRQPVPTRVALWVGPEGGWSVSESECFSGAGVNAVRLGQSILRTETAGPVAVAVARLALGDW